MARITSKRSRAWLFTWNNYPADYSSHLDTLAVSYIVAGEEVAPATGTPHLQGYLYFTNARTLSAVRKLLPGCHLTTPNGTHQQNDQYCRKTR